MEKKIISCVYISLFLVVVVFSIYKVNKKHEEKLYEVLYGRIEYAANSCYLDNACNDNIVLLDLYEKGYLDVQYDPITKEEINKETKITINEDNINVEK